MSKGILVMDMPEYCAACPAYAKVGSQICHVKHKCVHDKNYYYDPANWENPEWCPIMKVPEKDNKCYFPDKYQEGYSNGWNACIRKILAEEGEDS